jgi:hypothetical protein
VNIQRSARELRFAADRYRALARAVGDAETERRIEELSCDLERQAQWIEDN